MGLIRGGGSGGGGGGGIAAPATAFLDNFDTAPALRYQTINPLVVSGPLAGWTSVGGLLVPPDSGNYGFSPNAIGDNGDGIVDSSQVLKYKVGTSAAGSLGFMVKYIDIQNCIYARLKQEPTAAIAVFEVRAGVATLLATDNTVSYIAGETRWLKMVMAGLNVRFEYNTTEPGVNAVPVIREVVLNARWLGIRGRIGWFTRPLPAGDTSIRFDSYSARMF